MATQLEETFAALEKKHKKLTNALQFALELLLEHQQYIGGLLIAYQSALEIARKRDPQLAKEIEGSKQTALLRDMLQPVESCMPGKLKITCYPSTGCKWSGEVDLLHPEKVLPLEWSRRSD